jgi:hypothetical protein
MSRLGLSPTFGAAGVSGDTFPNDGHTFIRVKNGSGSPITVTVAPARAVDGLTPAGRTVSIPATTGDVSIGPFPGDDYNTDGTASVSYSSVTTVTVAVVSLPRF